MVGAPGSTGPDDAALGKIDRLLASRPAAAAEHATAFLRIRPGHSVATLYLGIARRLMGDPAGALKVLQPLARSRPQWAAAQYELGVTEAAAGRARQALASLRRAVSLQVDIGEAWLLIADQLLALGDPAGADAAYANHRVVSSAGPRLHDAAAAICHNHLADAEAMLRRLAERQPADAEVLRLLAEVAIRTRRLGMAERLLWQSLELAPAHPEARQSLAVVLLEQDKRREALDQVDRLLASDPRNPAWLNLKANVLLRLGDIDAALTCFSTVLADHPDNARIWVAYADALKTAGRQADAIDAYRRACAVAPGFGEAWWSLSNLKTFHFAPADVATMEAQLANAALSGEDRLHLHFAIGKALEDSGEFAESFANYSEGNRIRRASLVYDAAAPSAYVDRARSLYDEDFFAARRDWGHDAPDPVFIVGLPRSGSTLIEQILASHSAVEGTMELPDVAAIAGSLLGTNDAVLSQDYPGVVAGLTAQQYRELGERYLVQTRIYRRHGTRLFIDKAPNNWLHVGLIHLMLPRARIIDARRHPMACCFSNFKQHFARGQPFTYSLHEVGRFYRDYVSLMRHFDAVLPGRVHRICYELLVTEPHQEIRRLLAHCDLPFEEACLHFHETQRPVNTASSEQVRRPVYREATDQWRNFAPWLQQLREALGPAIADYEAESGVGSSE
jgi:tetratricopeptide (TPR) repeat protein